jgi:hypothetical protein
MIIAIWIFTLLLVGLWSLAAWGLAALLGTDAGWVDRIQMWLVDAPFGDWLDAWVPGWMMATQAMLDALQALLAWLGGATPWLVGVVWLFGALGLLGLGGVLTLIVALVRRAMPPTQPPAAAAT